MSTLPRAEFGDSLLVERRRRRRAYFAQTLRDPWFLLGATLVIALVAVHWLAWVTAEVILVLGAWGVAGKRAGNEWLSLLLDALHLTPDLPEVMPVTPLLRAGDEQVVQWAATDGRRRLLAFQVVEIVKSNDGDERTYRDFTVVLHHDNQPVIRYLAASERRAPLARLLRGGPRHPEIGNVEPFTVESVDLSERFELRTAAADGGAGRQVFEPSFIVWFARHGLPFEYEEGDLAVFVDRRLEHVEEFKLLLRRADAIHDALTNRG